MVERVREERLPLLGRSRGGSEGEEERDAAVNGGQGRRVLPGQGKAGQGAAGSACAPGKKPGKLVRAAVEARYRRDAAVWPLAGTVDVTVSPAVNG